MRRRGGAKAGSSTVSTHALCHSATPTHTHPHTYYILYILYDSCCTTAPRCTPRRLLLSGSMRLGPIPEWAWGDGKRLNWISERARTTGQLLAPSSTPAAAASQTALPRRIPSSPITLIKHTHTPGPMDVGRWWQRVRRVSTVILFLCADWI